MEFAPNRFGELAADAQVHPSDLVSGEWEFARGVPRHQYRKSPSYDVVDISGDVHKIRLVRLVADTNVVIAAFRSSSGASNELLRQAASGAVKLLCSTALFLEYEAVLGRPEVRVATGHSLEDVESVMDAIGAIAEPVDVHFRTRPTLRDPNDEMVLEVASNGDADYIVTHNLRDFAPALELGIAVVAPREILRRLRI